MPLRIAFARNVSQGATSEAAVFRCKTVPPFQPETRWPQRCWVTWKRGKARLLRSLASEMSEQEVCNAFVCSISS